MNHTRRILAALVLILLSFSASAKEFKVYGPQGGLAMNLTLPDNFDQKTDRCPMVILMHGIFSSKDFSPMPQIAKSLAKRGVASIRFDFGGHWRSQGKMINMTIPKEIEDARAMWNYASSLEYVSEISLLGHSQGGVIASMLAGMLSSEGSSPVSLVLLAPGSVIPDAIRSGHFFGNTFDPKNPPKYIKCFGMFKVGREYMQTSQTLEIYETSKAFTGPVCLVHGDNDTTVPLRCSRQYDEVYVDSKLHIIKGENHRFTKHTQEMIDLVTDFLAAGFGLK